MTLTLVEAEHLKAHMREMFRAQGISFDLSSTKPGHFVIVVRPHVSDETVTAAKQEAIRFAAEQFGNVINEHAFDVARINIIEAL
jgi:hypothetical protein